MDLDLPIRTFDSFGGGSTFGSVIALVELNEESFGDGLDAIEMQMYFKSELPQSTDQWLRDSYHQFHEVQCAALPVRRFMRKKRVLKIEALAEFGTAEEIWSTCHPFNLQWQATALDMLIREVDACKKKFKATDDFRFYDFLDWLRQQHENLPRTREDAEKLDQLWRSKSDAKRDQLDDWELLGIDWGDYHKSARDVVSDPRLWSQGHEFAPNGNDNGADLTSIFRTQKSRWARGGGNAFYKKLARDWGFNLNSKPDDSIDYQMKREVLVGLAFAFLKLFAYCPEWLADEAVQTIEDYRTFLETHHLDWPERELCLTYQELMLDCLKSCPREQS